MRDEFDVVVVGAGPAGAAAALAARRAGAGVLLLDRADFPRDKACGDGIAAHALDVLAELGVADAVAGYPPVPALRLIAPGGGAVARALPRPAYTVPRQVFDARLVAAAVDAGAVLRRRAVRRVEARPDRVVLDGEISARVLVGADGAGSVVRRALGQRANPDRHLALAIRGYAAAPPGPPVQLIVTSVARWPAYAWSFPIGDGRANVGYGEVLRGEALSRAHLACPDRRRGGAGGRSGRAGLRHGGRTGAGRWSAEREDVGTDRSRPLGAASATGTLIRVPARYSASDDSAETSLLRVRAAADGQARGLPGAPSRRRDV